MSRLYFLLWNGWFKCLIEPKHLMHLWLDSHVYMSDKVVKLCHSDFEIAILTHLQVFVFLLHHGV